jgi:uncharacterized membrane protein YraQ (UPF0718 family)
MKWSGSTGAVTRTLATGDFAPRAAPFGSDGVAALAAPFVQTASYLAVVWPALVLGILIAAGVRAFVSPRWLARLLGSGGTAREQIAAGLAGAPLMLCSCCVAPLFSSVYARSRRLGPSLGLMVGSPALNPAALVLTFALFSRATSFARLAMAATTVLLATAVIGRLFAAAPGRLPEPAGSEPEAGTTGMASTLAAFLRSLGQVSVRTVPLIVVGVLGSVLIARAVPIESLAGTGGTVATIALVSAVAVPLALPTFFEIPIALTLLGAGAPAGAAAALLFAGPAVNLPSLVTVARATSWRVAVVLGSAVWAIAFVGGLLVGE